MNRTFGQIFNSLVVLALGVALIAMHNEIRLMEYMVMLIGIAFIIPSVYLIIGTLYYRKKGLPAYYSTAGLVSAIGSLCIGVLLLSIPTFFIGFLTYLLAALMVLWGIAHIIALIRSSSTYRYSLWLYIMPTATTIAGVVILASSVKEIQSVVVLITGIAMVASSLNFIAKVVCQKIIDHRNSLRQSTAEQSASKAEKPETITFE